MAGLFFCLASAEDAGLFFCLATIQPSTSVYSAFCAVNASIPLTLQNIAQGFTGAFPVICPILPPQIQDRHKRLYITCATLERITAPQRLQRVPDTTAAPDAVQLSTAAYYNKVYKGATDRKTYKPGGLQSGTGQRSGRTWSTWHPPPGGAVQRQSRSGRRGTIDGSRRISFRAFAR